MKTVFDIRGQVCPSTLLVTLREVNTLYDELFSGQRKLEVLTDSRKATQTIPEAVENMGLQVTVSAREGFYEIVIASEKTAS